MRHYVTLNEYIASLQKIAQTHGDEELLSTGSCTGTFDGMDSPRSIHLISNGKEQTFYVPCYKEAATKTNGQWKDGRLQIQGGVFHFWIKFYDESSGFGINGGRISKLTIKNERNGKEVVNYDRGWDIEPSTKSAQAALDWVLRNFN